MYNPQLTTFISVAENDSFTKAADALFITPTAVMKQINTLEERLGITLFDRTNHGLQLTEAGKSFLQDAKYIIDYSDRAIEKAREIDNKDKQQSIRIGTSIMTPAKFLLDVWAEIQKFNPYLKIELIPFENTPINSVEILKNLGKHIDIVAGLYDDNFLKERGCQAAHLYDKQLLFAIPVTNPLCSKRKIELADLKGQKVLLIRKNWNEYIDELREDLTASGVTVEEFEMFNLNAYNRAVQENVPIITVEGWEDVHPLLKIVPADWEYRIPFGILYSPTPSKQVKDFIGAMKKISLQ
ncbi:MAG: LysR family transcriptional regulator [Clostridiales bacterium]|nr:LysR family transcriptional regulator [Clostridiales bacterium]